LKNSSADKNETNSQVEEKESPEFVSDANDFINNKWNKKMNKSNFSRQGIMTL
jgi:hypothetical protein